MHMKDGREVRVNDELYSMNMSSYEKEEQRKYDPYRQHVEEIIDKKLSRMNITETERRQRKNILLMLEDAR